MIILKNMIKNIDKRNTIIDMKKIKQKRKIQKTGRVKN